MQGFVNFADDIGTAIAFLLPAFCYLGGVSFILGAIWGFWQLPKGGHHAARPWVPFVTLFIGAALLSYDRIVNLAEATIGGGHTASMSDSLTAYTPPTVNPGTLAGTSPEQTVLNVINVFQYFFMCYGALIVMFGIVGLKHISEGKRRHGPSLAVIQIVFGLAVMNVDEIAPIIMSYFGATTT